MDTIQSNDFSPTIIKDVLLLSPGKWNNVDYTDHEILKAFNSTDWNDKKNRMLYLDHQDTKERGVANFGGFVQNVRLLGASLFGDLEVWNPMVAMWLSKAKAKFGISATLAGRENRQLQKMEDFHFQSFSVVTDPACKPAMINLSANQVGDVQTVITLNETKELESVKHRERREDSEETPQIKSPQEDALVKEFELSAEEVEKLATEELVKELDAIFERQVSHIKDSLKHSHPEWSEKKIEQVAYATANKMKKEDEKKNAEKIDSQKSLSEQPRAGDVTEDVKHLMCDISHKGETADTKLLKGGIKMPEIIENKSEVATENSEVKTEEVKTEEVKTEVSELKKEEKAESKPESKPEPKSKEEPRRRRGEEDKEEEELSSEAILNKVKEMSSEELVNYTNFVREYLSANVNASAKEVTLAYMKSKADKDKKKELSANELLASIDQRIASLKELDSSKKMLELETKVKELSAKVKTPDRKTLSAAFDGNAKDSNLGMLSFLQNRMN